MKLTFEKWSTKQILTCDKISTLFCCPFNSPKHLPHARFWSLMSWRHLIARSRGYDVQDIPPYFKSTDYLFDSRYTSSTFPVAFVVSKLTVSETSGSYDKHLQCMSPSLFGADWNIRVVYCSATGASEPRNLGYMTRLGLWGAAGSPFPGGFRDFLTAVDGRCVLLGLKISRVTSDAEIIFQ